MSSLNHIIELLKEKLDDLQRDTQFCVKNYDYHHKNNEHEILQNLQDTLKESFQDGQEFLSHMNNLRSLIDTARKKCSDIDELLIDMGVDTEKSLMTDVCSSSRSFQEDQETGKYSVDVLEEN